MKILLWLVGGLALLLAYWYWYLLGLGNAQEVYLVPQGFRGVVYILFEQPNGVPPEREGWKRIYRIPRSGVLRTQFSFQEGPGPLPEFFWDSAGQRRPLRYQILNHRRPPRGVYVSTIETGSGGCYFDAQDRPQEPVDYESFIVADSQNVKKFYTELREHEYTPSELICDITLTDEDSVKRF
ncbi:DUF6843 domain-containing protein [Hymenobacter terrenus]|uniref:DUF6843 domain-containing protein n=1 Tax=Hymenobacter terrenus TaxID=1629124 RepID=UPI001E43C89C|nr:hypothetical protein [Hymenobacter terrenus]